jgi:hypothetical protein
LAVPGSPGPTGPSPQGGQGPKGIKGLKGNKGIAGPTGPTGAKGPKGGIGDKGPTGAGGASDIRLKENFQYFEDSLEKIMKLRGVEFVWADVEENSPDIWEVQEIGFIAQEVKEVIPELAFQFPSGLYGVKYENMVALIVDGIQKQKLILDEKEKQLEILENKAKEKGLI